jgi:hypothetical protein
MLLTMLVEIVGRRSWCRTQATRGAVLAARLTIFVDRAWQPFFDALDGSAASCIFVALVTGSGRLTVAFARIGVALTPILLPHLSNLGGRMAIFPWKNNRLGV